MLRDIDLIAEPGQVTAIIGGTGSGKTTLLGLDPAAVRRDRRRRCSSTAWTCATCDPAVLSGLIGLVPQRPYLFSGTVARNLRYGKPDATDDELWQALEIAQARDFVEQMPGGLDAPIAQGGTNVSGGQRQRLAIARAMVHQPEIYLFDDSFSALDFATDAALRAALTRGDRRRATVRDRRAAGRDDQARRPDRRARGGPRSSASGTHDELMRHRRDVPGDRAVPADRAGGAHERPDGAPTERLPERASAERHAARNGQLPAARGSASPEARPWASAGHEPWDRPGFMGGMSTEKALNFGGSSRRLLRMLAPQRAADHRRARAGRGQRRR